MRNINPFYIQKAVDSTVGKVKHASRLKNGTLLVEVNYEKQADVLLKASLLGSYPIQVKRLVSLKFFRGVVTTDSVDGMTDEEIQPALVNQSVSKVHRLIGKRDGKPFPLRTVFLTFEVPTLPCTLFFGYERVIFRPNIPNTMSTVWAQTATVCVQPCVL
jgi:hypothetical protein